MDRQQIALKLSLDALNLPLRLSSFSDRLILQKAVYLAQAAGVQLGYSYNWYLRGPYSPALTRDGFAVVAELNQGLDESQGNCLDPASLQRLGTLRKLLESVPTDELPSRLELLASVGFLLRTPAAQGKDARQLQDVLLRFGKSYTVEQIQNAIEELKSHGLARGNSSA
jgi:hypothetical protein